MRSLRTFCYALALSAGVLSPDAAEAQNWYAVEVFEVDDVYPVEVGKAPGDETSIAYAAVPPGGLESWSRATRPEESAARNQLSTAFDVRFRVEWYDPGGFSSSILVETQGAARAHILSGVSALLPQGGGDFGASAITGDLSQSATTDGHAAPYSHEPTPTSILQLVAEDGAITSRVTIHPTAGLTKPGSFKGYGIVVWWLVE